LGEGLASTGPKQLPSSWPRFMRVSRPPEIQSRRSEERYFIGSTSLASTSMAIERMIKSTETTSRIFPFLRSKTPFRPSSEPLLMRTRERTFRYGLGRACTPMVRASRIVSIRLEARPMARRRSPLVVPRPAPAALGVARDSRCAQTGIQESGRQTLKRPFFHFRMVS